MSVTPSTDLVDGQVVTITAAGYTPGTTVFVATCPPGAVIPTDCDTGHYLSQTADDAGVVTIPYDVRRVLLGGIAGPLDCAVATCTIGATGDPFGSGGSDPQVPITFALPHLTVTVDTVGTLDAAGAAVVQAHVSCDIATQISAVSVITQGAEARPFTISVEQCTPGQATPLFLAGYPTPVSAPLSLGSVSVDVTVAPSAATRSASPGRGWSRSRPTPT